MRTSKRRCCLFSTGTPEAAEAPEGPEAAEAPEGPEAVMRDSVYASFKALKRLYDEKWTHANGSDTEGVVAVVVVSVSCAMMDVHAGFLW